MKPKYYSYFFLSLFACGKENTEIQNVAINDDFFKSLNAIYKENDTTQYTGHVLKLVKSYDSSFGNLEECEKIFKQLCELKQPYTTQAIYDVLYALLKNKCISAAEVQLILQHIKDNFENSYSLLNNFVFTKFNIYAKKNIDSSARTIIDFFHVNSHDFIQIPKKEKFQINNLEIDNALELENFTNIYQCVRYINLNENFTKDSLEKLISLDNEGGSFNDAIKYINPSFQYPGDKMMNFFVNKNVNLNDEGLKALAEKITKINSLNKLIPSLKNCTNLEPILDKYNNNVSGNFLSELVKQCPENYLDLINSIPKEKMGNITSQIEKVIDLENSDENQLKKMVDFCEKYIDNPATNSKEYNYYLGLIDRCVDLNDEESCNKLIKKLFENVNLGVLNKLVQHYNNASEKFNKLLSLISKEKFNKSSNLNVVISKFKDKNIKLDDGNLTKIFSLIDDSQKISNWKILIKFCCNNIKNLKDTNIEAVFDKVNDKSFDLNALYELCNKKQEKFDKILPCIPDEKLKQLKFTDIVKILTDHKIKLNYQTRDKVRAMMNNTKIYQESYPMVIGWCCKIENLDQDSFKEIINLCDNFKFDEQCLEELIKQCKNDDTNKLNNILSWVYDDTLKDITVNNIDGTKVFDSIKNVKGILKKNIKHILSMIAENKKIPTNKSLEVFKFCCDNKFEKEDINNILEKCEDDFKFDLTFLDLYDSKCSDQFNAVLAEIQNNKLINNCDANEVLKKIQQFIPNDKNITIDKDILKKILLSCKNESKITDVDALYEVFRYFYNDEDVVTTLKSRVGNLNGDQVFNKFNPNNQEFFLEFCYYIRANSICNIQDRIKFIKAAFALYQANKLADLKDKFNVANFNSKSKNKISLQNNIKNGNKSFEYKIYVDFINDLFKELDIKNDCFSLLKIKSK